MLKESVAKNSFLSTHVSTSYSSFTFTPSTSHFPSTYQLPHYFQTLPSNLHLTLSYSFLQSPSDTHSLTHIIPELPHLISSLFFQVLTFTSTYTDQ